MSGGMTDWASISCQRGHRAHEVKQTRVVLGGPTPYHDYAPIPERLACSFDMLIYDTDMYPVDGGPYCPAHDAVSETVGTLGVWEPRESILAASVFASSPAGYRFVDLGSQLGWFSLLAMAWGVEALAVDADGANLAVLQESAERNGWTDRLRVSRRRIGPKTKPLPADVPVRLAKLDLEGAENYGIAMLRPLLDARMIDHLLIEVSPCFDSYYPDLVAALTEQGFEAYLLPEKHQPPWPLDDPERDLAAWRLPEHPIRLRETVSRWAQEDVWFRHRDASW